MDDPLRSRYDFALTGLEKDRGSRGRAFRAVSSGARVLDIGCDTGRFGEALIREKGCDVYGIERDPEAAREAAQRLRKVYVRSVDSEGALNDLGVFDAILFLDVLEHLYDPWAVLRRASEILRPGGVIVGVVPNIAHISVVRRLLRGQFNYLDHGTMDRTHVRWFTRESFGEALVQGGFVRTNVEIVPVVPWVQEWSRIGQPLAEMLARWLPDLLGGSLFGTGFRPEVRA